MPLDNSHYFFGLWHAYAHCLKRSFFYFRHWWAILENKQFLTDPEGTAVYLKPHVSFLEQVVAATYLVHGSKRVRLLKTVLQVESDFGKESRVASMAQGLRLLVVEYIPALFTLGVAVREV